MWWIHKLQLIALALGRQKGTDLRYCLCHNGEYKRISLYLSHNKDTCIMVGYGSLVDSDNLWYLHLLCGGFLQVFQCPLIVQKHSCSGQMEILNGLCVVSVSCDGLMTCSGCIPYLCNMWFGERHQQNRILFLMDGCKLMIIIRRTVTKNSNSRLIDGKSGNRGVWANDWEWSLDGRELDLCMYLHKK